MNELDLKAPMTVLSTVAVQDVLQLLVKEGFDQMPVIDTEGLEYLQLFCPLSTDMLTRSFRAVLRLRLRTVLNCTSISTEVNISIVYSLCSDC